MAGTSGFRSSWLASRKKQERDRERIGRLLPGRPTGPRGLPGLGSFGSNEAGGDLRPIVRRSWRRVLSAWFVRQALWLVRVVPDKRSCGRFECQAGGGAAIAGRRAGFLGRRSLCARFAITNLWSDWWQFEFQDYRGDAGARRMVSEFLPLASMSSFRDHEPVEKKNNRRRAARPTVAAIPQPGPVGSFPQDLSLKREDERTDFRPVDGLKS